jgi:diguanylate cyclase (GGDEF)-like protein
MGIRVKLLLTFIICFGMMAGIGLPLLQRRMDESYDAIERKELTAHMGRVVQSIEAGLESLKSQTSDWAVWTEMYDYAIKRNQAWADENIGANAMAPAKLSLVMVFGAKGQLLLMTTRDDQGAPLPLSGLLTSPYATLFTAAPLTRETHCGLIKTDAGMMLTCWARLARSDTTGDFVGTVVMGRLLDQAFLTKLREQTKLAFDVQEGKSMPPGLQRWTAVLQKGSIGQNDFWSSNEPGIYHMAYPLQDLLGKEIGLLTLDISRDLHEQGQKLYRDVRRQFVWIALGTAILLVRRVRVLTNQLVAVAKDATWETRIKVKGSDELGILSASVNTLLGLIEYQVDELKFLTLTDTLTGLPNRREFDARVAAEFARKQRYKQPLALLMLDVDYFKRYNDRYGHPAGDDVLQALARVLTSVVSRSGDLAARIGGEEFAVLLPDTDIKGAMALAERIRLTLHERNLPHADSSVAPYLTVSIGVAIAGTEALDAFISRADRALYQAKNAGRDRAVFVDA